MTRWTTTRWTTTLGALALGCLAALAGSRPAAAQKIIINQAGQTTTASSIYLARDMGFFQKEGLDVSFINTGSSIKAITPLVSGATQFCACIVSHPMAANQAGAANTRMFAAVVNGYPTKVVLRKDLAAKFGLKPDMPLADRVRMLKGLKIGVTELGASTDVAMRLGMLAYGLNPERDAVIIALGPVSAALPAMSNQQVDAVSESPPGPQQVIKEGAGELLFDPMGEHIGPLGTALFMAIAGEKSYIDSHRDVAIRVTRAIAAGQAYLHQHREEARKVVKDREFPTMPQEAFDAAFEGQFPTYSETPVISRESVEGAIQISKTFSPGFSQTWDTLIDPTIAPEALKQ